MLVDAVAEAHDLALARRGRRPASGLGVVRPMPISSKVCMTASFAPPCSGPLSAPMAPVTAEYRSRERRGDDPRGERRGVERVLGVEDHRDVEGVDDDVVGLLAERHPQEVRRSSRGRRAARRAPGRGAGAGRRRRWRGSAANRSHAPWRGSRLGRASPSASGSRAPDHADGGAHDVHRVRGRRQLVDDATAPTGSSARYARSRCAKLRPAAPRSGSSPCQSR